MFSRVCSHLAVRHLAPCLPARSYSVMMSSWRMARSSPASMLWHTHKRHMFIQTQTTPNHNSLKFLPGRDVSPSQSYDFSSYREASISPLAQQLFSIEGVRSVYLGSDFISINIEEGKNWNYIKPEVFSIMMDFFSGDRDVVSAPRISSTTILPEDDETVAMIKELIDTRIRPAVQEDGGDIDYKSFDKATGIVLVQMQGSCKGCASSSITLKNGIENMLMHYVPEVKSVQEFTDDAQTVQQQELDRLEEKLKKQRETDDKQTSDKKDAKSS